MGGPEGSAGAAATPKASCTAPGVPRPPPWRSQSFNGGLLFPRGSCSPPPFNLTGSKMGSTGPFWGFHGGLQPPQRDSNQFKGVCSLPSWGSRGSHGGLKPPGGSHNPPTVSNELHPPLFGGPGALTGVLQPPQGSWGSQTPPLPGGRVSQLQLGSPSPRGVLQPPQRILPDFPGSSLGCPPPQPLLGVPGFPGGPQPLLGVPWSVGEGSPQHSRDSQPPPRVPQPPARAGGSPGGGKKGGPGGVLGGPGPVSVSEPRRAESVWKNGGKRRNFRPGRRRRR